MKIAIFVSSWPPGAAASGIVTYASYLVPALRRLGHEVFVLAARKAADDDDPDTIDLQRFTSVKSKWDGIAWKLVPKFAHFKTMTTAIVSAIEELLKRHQLDAFEMEESFGWSSAVSRLNLFPVIVRLHGPCFLTGRYADPRRKSIVDAYRQRKEGKGISHADFVTSPSAEVLRAVRDQYGLRLAASDVIPNPITSAGVSEVWNADVSSPDALLFVGRFDESKGGDLVLRAFAELATTHPNARLTFVGQNRGIKVSRRGDILLEEFVRTNISEQFHSRIEFRGQVPHAEVMSYRRTHFATIIASQYETAGYSVLEAMAMGCPLIATAVGGIPERIENQRNGLVVPPQNVRAMADACRALFDNRALAARMGRQAWLDCRASCDPEIVAKRTIGAYQEAAEMFKSRIRSRRYFMSSQ